MCREVIYQVFVRNHTNEGTLKALEKDLERIKDLGVTIIYLMPIHDIGVEARKGSWGSPYAIKDYCSISHDLGTLGDFHSLLLKTHKLGMRLIMDMVFNHTSPDNELVKSHNEYYFHKEDGSLGNRIGDWSDIRDLDTYRKDTQEYLLTVLKYWLDQGVDGFRFDVASLLPIEFFIKARKVFGDKPYFLAESIDDDFVRYAKSLGLNPVPDKELFPTFNSLYNYNWYRPLEHHYKYGNPIEIALDKIKNDKLAKYRIDCLENHDTDRISELITDKKELIKMIKFVYSLPGHAFIYAGQENGISHRPNLFEKDPIDWANKDDEIYELYRMLNKQKTC